MLRYERSFTVVFWMFWNELRLVCAFYQKWFVLAYIFLGFYMINAVAKYGTFGKVISWTQETISYDYTVSPSCKKQIATHWIFNHSNLSFIYFFSLVYSFARDFMWNNINGNILKDIGICYLKSSSKLESQGFDLVSYCFKCLTHNESSLAGYWVETSYQSLYLMSLVIALT